MKRPSERNEVAARCESRPVATDRAGPQGDLVCGAAILLGLGLGASGWAATEENEGPPKPPVPWRVTATVNYSSGSYGEATNTNILYAPLTVRRVFRDGDLSVTIPFVSVSGTGSVRLVGGVPTRTGGTGGGAVSTVSGGTGRGKNPEATPLSSTTTDSGVGDVIVRGRYYLVEEGDVAPLVAVTGRLKVPTADADRGLGTGEFDEGAGLEFTKTIADRWLAYLDAGYNLIGDAPGTNFNNQWWYDVGVGHDVTDALHVSVFYEEYRTLVNSVSNARDVLAVANYMVDESVHINTSLLVGLSNGAPQYGVGAGVRVRF